MNAADYRRRWFGLFFLTVAAGMLIWGLTVLERHLTGWWFLAFWLVCLLCTLTSMIVAWIDWRAIRARRRPPGSGSPTDAA